MGNLRVIGGERKGFPLSSPRGLVVRPTSGRVREALFDILGSRIAGSRFLDLFAGTGAVGIEALSRGAGVCVFLEMDRRAAALIRSNLAACGFGSRGRVILGRLPVSLSRLPAGERFDLVFVDPPYDDREAEAILGTLGRSGYLSPGSRIILEHRKSWAPPARSGSMDLLRSVRYGDSVLSFFVPRAEDADRKV